MKTLSLLFAAGLISGMATLAHGAEDPIEVAIEIRHGLMLQMANEMGKMGAMAKGEAAYDAAVASQGRRQCRGHRVGAQHGPVSRRIGNRQGRPAALPSPNFGATRPTFWPRSPI